MLAYSGIYKEVPPRMVTCIFGTWIDNNGGLLRYGPFCDLIKQINPF